MGLLDGLGRIFETVAAPVAAFVTGGPTTALATYANQGRARTAERQILENSKMAYTDPFDSGFGTNNNLNQSSSNTGGFFSDLGSGIASFGRGFSDFITDVTPTANIFGLNLPGQGRVPQAATTIINQRPEETRDSGDFLGANLGMGGLLLNSARSLARSPAGQGLIGGGLGVAGALVTQNQSGMPRVTRRMKSDVRRIYNMSGMDPAATAAILNNLGTYPKMNFNAALVFFILTKRFRNDGPVVTKAAVRKTKTTLRRMKGVVDMYNSVCKPTTRRAPARRAAPKAVQLIKN